LLGPDAHDVGGYGPGLPPRPTRPGADRLRTARVLEPGLFITVEPGAYFIRSLLEPLLGRPAGVTPRTAPAPPPDPRSRWLVQDRVRASLDMGGVRLEDDVLMTANGIDVLSAGLPREVEDVRAVMAGGDWPDIL
jgi:Xaa-Pro dipeptidase